MSDLLKKKRSNLLSKSEVHKPTQPYEKNSLIKRSNSVTTELPKKNKENKTTTIRCSMETALHLNSIITCQNFNSVNECLIHLIDFFEGNLTADERREISQIKSVLMRKTK